MADKYEVIVNDGEIILPQEVIDLFDQVRTIDATIKMLKEQKDEIEKPLKMAMAKNGVNSFKCQYMTATKVKDGFTESINTELMKKDGVYDKYAVKVPKSGYIRITYKKESDNG